MRYATFKARVHDRPLIFTRDLMRGVKDRQALLNQVGRWEERGLLVQLRRGIYMLHKSDRKIEPSPAYIANQLYTPSYVSLEYALGSYGLIPERVHDVTSVSTRKTCRMTNPEGVFVYQHVKPAAFRGFRAVKDERGLAAFIAEPEKALVDFIYLNLEKFRRGDAEVFSAGYRFQNAEDLSAAKLRLFAAVFASKKLRTVVEDLVAWVRKESQT